MIPSIPPSPLLPSALPASCRLPPYPILTRRSTTTRSKNEGEDSLTVVRISDSRADRSLLYADARASSGVKVDSCSEVDA